MILYRLKNIILLDVYKIYVYWFNITKNYMFNSLMINIMID
jgi:hypothetical protein